jgi:two-component system, LuxR family, sensor kinase FixL
MDALLRIYAPQRRTALLVIAIGLIAAIATIDAATEPYMSLEFLYLFPIIIVGGILGRSQIIVVAVTCAGLGEAFAELPANEMTVRFLFSSAGLAGTGLFIAELVRNREAALVHARALEAQQQRVRDAEEELQFLVDTSPAAIITIDAEGRIMLANEAAHRLLESEAEPLRGQPISSYLPALHSVLQTHSSTVLRTALQCRGHRKNGEAFLAGVWFSTNTTLSGLHLAAIVVDLSEELRSREDLSFEHLLRSARVLMNAVAHETRNICSAALVVHKNLSQLEELRGTDDFEALGTLMESLKALMTTQLQPSMNPTTTIELTTVFDELRVLLEAAYGEPQVEIDWQLPESLPLVRAERYGLIQVFLNLAKNSLRAMEATATKRLRVRGSEDAHSFRIHFEDTGVGVASPERLFRPFESGAASTGLGLYVSRAMIRSFGGDLLYEPRAQGACFTVVLAVATVGAAVDV